ncbi:MAG: peptide chain release factor N(5)-glutamine methyltransferase [Clostridia bacterium]|nr:peptide chain release factor N(5)-glutamine methyltransferase [Clostridia bacterium]
MTQRQWHAHATAMLTAAGCEDAAFDARCLLEDLSGLPRGHAPRDTELTAEQSERLARALNERADGRPLQYILGQWDFLSLTLAVGEGVLIPRADTECLCELVARRLGDVDRPCVLDLCAGSGCVGLGIASLCDGVQVTAVELSDAALPFLRENVARYPSYAVTVRQADVLAAQDAFEDGWDAIVSNPPYIPSGDLDALMREVQREPRMALDGDIDGLKFYRAIAQNWCSKLRYGGVCAVEVGIGQAQAVAALFTAVGLTDVGITRDLGGVERVVFGTKK